MFNSISGVITSRLPHRLYLDCNGVEWDICVPESSLDALPPAGSAARIFTWLSHTETAMQLYGFSSAGERDVFLDLLKVDGIGAKGAVRIMSSVSSGRLTEILDRGDVEMLEKIPGVGKKTAAKMMLALKGKLSVPAQGVRGTVPCPEPDYADVLNSLVDMGYERQRAAEKIEVILGALSSDPEFQSRPKAEREELLFRRAIIEMA